ncbi:MAG: polysaccharide biosynthesis protein, partial [Rhodothermales bacterium]|nr:polysaccharide biosynthesis protein [Rhodothermales bacterium]
GEVDDPNNPDETIAVFVGNLDAGFIGVLGLRASIRFFAERMTDAVSGTNLTVPEADLSGLQDRPEVEIDGAAVSNYLTGRTVLVTGAGGSVGSVLSKRLLKLNPFRLVLVDVSEYNLYKLENELRGSPFTGELIFRIADVREEAIMRATFAAYRPDVVFHAAAYKHVPLMERHPAEAFTNNTLATVSLVRICESFGTEQFIFVSTDKAVEPSSVLGATKRLSEWYIRSIDSEMECKSIRFGNVLNSQGSVVPMFVDQIRRGGPVTVTHPDMERFFMSGNEAASLILATLLLDEAPIFAARMGTPVQITKLARFLIGGIASNPDRVVITYTGLRPGEKLSERLWSEDEYVVDTANPTIVGIRAPAAYSRTELDAYFRYLEHISAENKTAELRKALFQSNLVETRDRAVGE